VLQRRSPFLVAENVLKQKYPEAIVAFVAGSFNRGEETPHSDIDLVVILPKLENGRREGFTYEGWPVEAFVHDPETLHAYLQDAKHKFGTAALLSMVIEGPAIPANNELGLKLKALAQKIYDDGPPKWDQATIDEHRYFITDLLNDLRSPRNRLECSVIVGSLHERLGHFYLRTNGAWHAERKQIPRKISKHDPAFYAEWVECFNKAYEGRAEQLVALVEKILQPFGGLLFDGYCEQGPKGWKVPLPD